MSTELSASPWTLKEEILEHFSQTPKQSRSSSFMISYGITSGSCFAHSVKASLHLQRHYTYKIKVIK